MFFTSRSLVLRNIPLKYKRFRHSKAIKQHEIKPEPKVATDVVNYLESTTDYKDIVDKIPKSLLRKYKAPETMYLINKNTAKCITETLETYIGKKSPIVEINPGFGYLTRELLVRRNNPIYLYEISNHFSQHLTVS